MLYLVDREGFSLRCGRCFASCVERFTQRGADMDRKVILVVEDNRDELMIYTTLLSYHGYAILAATDFDSALEIAAEQKPDLALVDVNLGDPHLDGCDLVKAFRTSTNSDMPVIAHTAFGDVYRRALERVGCETVIHKPTEPGVLLQAVELLIGPPVLPAEDDP
jgi:two-component system, cell cycle response regulator DivK